MSSEVLESTKSRKYFSVFGSNLGWDRSVGVTWPHKLKYVSSVVGITSLEVAALRLFF